MIQFMFQVPVCFGSSVDFDPPPRRVSLEHHLSRYGSNMLKNCLNNTFGNGRSLDFIYVYIYIYYSYIYIYDYLFIFVPIPPVWAIPTHSKTRSMQWSLRCSVLLLRNLCAAADGCWAECGRSGYYCPEFCCQPTDGGNPSCWDEAGIYTFSKCHWV